MHGCQPFINKWESHTSVPMLGTLEIFINLFYRNMFLWWSLCLLAYREHYRQILKCGSYCMTKVWIRFCFIEAKLTFFYVVLTKWDFLRAATVLTVTKKIDSCFWSYAESPWFQRGIKECTPVLWWLLCPIVMLLHIFKQISWLLLNILDI